SAGGAIANFGALKTLSNSTFVRNKAMDEGPAILNIGTIDFMQYISFEENTFHCHEGLYLMEEEVRVVHDSSDRYGTVCARCSSSCEPSNNCTVLNAKVPTCEVPLDNTISPQPGVTVATLALEKGYWRTSNTSVTILGCYNKDACLGGVDTEEYCAPGYTGPYCTVCSEGYAPYLVYSCRQCTGGSKTKAQAMAGIILAFATIGVAVVITYLLSADDNSASPPRRTWIGRIRERIPFRALKIVVVVWQIISQFTTVAGVVYPGVYQHFIGVVDFFNLDIGIIFSIGCIDIVFGFYNRLLTSTIGPLVVMVALLATYSISRLIHGKSASAMVIVNQKHMSMALLLTFLIYSSVSSTVFLTFACDDLDDGRSLLRADYSLSCNTNRHLMFKIYAGVMILVYPIGIPFLYGVLLFRHRHALRSHGVDRGENVRLKAFSDLWGPYKPKVFYYELVECFRRVMLTGLVVFIYPDSAAQIAATVGLAFAFQLVSEVLSPHSNPIDKWLYRIGQVVVLASMYLALLLRVDVSDEHKQGQDAFEWVLILFNCAMVIAIVTEGLLL
ncbi:unnamed protein product, partial [Choristocarpus tenellus]